jgi:hypothetical protein
VDWAPSTGCSTVRVVGIWRGRHGWNLEFKAIEGDDATAMLNATAKQWARHLIEEVGFDQAVILESRQTG